MNLQPLLVNFPLAFISVYTLLEVVRIKRFSDKPFWFHLKATFVLVSLFLSIPAIVSGLIVEKIITNTPQNLIEVHKFFIIVAALIYFIIAAAYSVEWVEESKRMKGLCAGMNKIGLCFLSCSRYILSSPMIVTLAIMAFCSVIIGHTLGVAMLFGPDVNPFVSVIFKLFVR